MTYRDRAPYNLILDVPITIDFDKSLIATWLTRENFESCRKFALAERLASHTKVALWLLWQKTCKVLHLIFLNFTTSHSRPRKCYTTNLP